MRLSRFLAVLTIAACATSLGAQDSAPPSPALRLTVLHAAHLLDVAAGKLISPGEILVAGTHIHEVGTHVSRPAGATLIDLGSATLMPGLIDAHTHLFLHTGNEASQTVDESVPTRTLFAAAAARADLLAGFTAERDMGTEGAGCADVAVRNAIDAGLIPGPRMRVSCNAIDITGGHEDSNGHNPEEHLLSNADRANTAAEIIAVMREQHKQGADFTKIYETGHDRVDPDAEVGGQFTTPFLYTEAELTAAVAEAHRTGSVVAVHATGEPGTGYAALAGVASIDHAYVLAPSTMKLMHDRDIYAVPTFTILEYFAAHAESTAKAADRRAEQALHAAEFRKQIAAGVPFAVGSDVGPFPHGTQAREYQLMVQYGMPAADVLRAGLVNGARLLGWTNEIGQLKPNFYADIIAVPADPLTDISTLAHPVFVMKNGDVVRSPSAPGATR